MGHDHIVDTYHQRNYLAAEDSVSKSDSVCETTREKRRRRKRFWETVFAPCPFPGEIEFSVGLGIRLNSHKIALGVGHPQGYPSFNETRS
jgi:hypothetical protein